MAAARKKGGARKAATKKPGSTKQTRRKRTAPKAPGAPRVEFDLEDLRRLAQVGCTNDTMAALLHVSKRTLQRRIADTPEVAAVIEDGRATIERNLRTAQLRNAIGGNPTMQIWLGKQFLGQRDVKAVELTGAGGGPLELHADLKPILEEKLAKFIASKANGRD